MVIPELCVSLFVRLWVEISVHQPVSTVLFRQPLREAVSWNADRTVPVHCYLRQPLREAVSWNTEHYMLQKASELSASSWGCELKYVMQCVSCQKRIVSASSWGCELKLFRKPVLRFLYGQPLREAVSWNANVQKKREGVICQPLREAVSWNIKNNKSITAPPCQPLREAVSWNEISLISHLLLLVSLFVRLWVEMEVTKIICLFRKSASSWGCELK